MPTNNMPLPWSKRLKEVIKASPGGIKYVLSNSFAEPLTSKELIDLTKESGDDDLIENFFNHSLEYTPNGGSLDLREEISKLYGDKISADNILVFPGAQVALQTSSRVLGREHCITFSPGYQSVVHGPQYFGGGETTQIELRADNGWQIDLKEVEEAIREDTRYIVINQPYNPAGILMSHEMQTRLRTIAEKNGIYILSDEVYRLLEHDPSDRLPAMADFYNKGLSVVTLSKPWGACGVTIGWIATQDKNILEQLSDAQYFGTACPSRASELQAIMVLRSSRTILQRNLKIILDNKTLLEKFMHTYSEFFTWVPPRSGAIAAIKFKGDLTSVELGTELAKEGISIKPAYCFVDDIREENDYFRVGFGESKMPTALEALARFVEERKEVWREHMKLSR